MTEPQPAHCICDRDTIAENMATPGCPIHAPLAKIEPLWKVKHTVRIGQGSDRG